MNKNNMILRVYFVLNIFLIFSCQNKNNRQKLISSTKQTEDINNTELYKPYPSFVFNQNGMYATGMLCLDLNKNGYMDVVNANGNDMSPQPLTINNNWSKKTGVPYSLSNYTSDIGFNTRIKAGDLNNDGYKDIIMITVFKRESFNPELYQYQSDSKLSSLYKTGSVKVYMNNKGFIPSTATYELELDTFPFDIDLGDVDADGDLDLAVANLAKFNEKGEFIPAKSVIFLNENGRIKNKKIWQTNYSFNALSIKFTDVNLDGLLDFVLGHTSGHYISDKKSETEEAITVFYGKLNELNKFMIDQSMGWSFEFGESLAAVTLDVGLLKEGENIIPKKRDVIILAGVQIIEDGEKEDRALKLLNSSHRMLNSSNDLRENFFVIGCEEKKVYWKTNTTDMKVSKPSFSSIGDVNNDGYADLILGFFKKKGSNLNNGAPFFIFKGIYEDSNEPRFKQIFRSRGYGVNQEIFLGYARKFDEIHPDKIEQRKFTQEYTNSKPVITLPCNVILSIDSVKVDGATQKNDAYNWNYATNVLTINNNNFKNNVALEVTYTTPLKKDIYIAYWNANKGNVIYYSKYVKPQIN